MKRGLKGTLIGIIIGGVAGILLAPKSGKDTQADIKRRVNNAKDDIHNRVDDLNDEISARLDYVKSASHDLKGEAKSQSQALVKRAEEFRHNAASSAAEVSASSGQTKDGLVASAKQLAAEGAEIMRELERLSKVLGESVKDKAAGLKDASKADDRASATDITEEVEKTVRRRKSDDEA